MWPFREAEELRERGIDKSQTYDVGLLAVEIVLPCELARVRC
jgi:hypothetical protein